ncbi:MAG: hypothetical protein Q8N70_07135, partial [Deltaproteobacteria bacterium]|nr:hypothetical protein [Deltaproteobacteria bacterium]
GCACPQTPFDRDPGWLGRKTDYEKETLIIMSSGFMGVVAVSGFFPMDFLRQAVPPTNTTWRKGFKRLKKILH